jgi:hypothetical protein
MLRTLRRRIIARLNMKLCGHHTNGPGIGRVFMMEISVPQIIMPQTFTVAFKDGHVLRLEV